MGLNVAANLKLRDKVKIKAYGIKGFVNSVWESLVGTQYDVEYLDKAGQICSRWFTPEEIEKTK